ncbi:DUF4396 domain-containing protein [Halogeometricum luteum]|uniref:DUF4396 domain-containing protein n=1 Tax=Halogeometricum luteum TaxID=2950537 RepID=A0ABU2G336_9EURY|nr:DUF4396 domain-containing protein [Halogeometricum sp. S3BR5-2]MDS0295200.1 DUF4396 domain-containing protein [Halogeometricum sp. S3BR5-2]
MLREQLATPLQGSLIPQWLAQFGKQLEHAFAPIRRVLEPVLSSPVVAGIWVLLVVSAVAVLWWDIRKRNEALPSMMKFVWTLTVVYSGPIGLAVYWWSGRTQIARDSLWRRGARSTSHCYSGCGLGEIVGITLAQGILGLHTLWVVVVTFGFAYLFGYGLNIGPLMQEGSSFREATRDALLSETPSITVMEIAAIGTDLLLAGTAGIGSVLFWMAMAFSLSVGFIAAYPVNAGLITFGVKEGMMNPKEMGQGSGA